MKAGSPIVLTLVLAACSQDPRGLALADVDLSDMNVVQEIRHQLPPEDRPVFSTYVVKHVATSSSFCGETLVDGNGREPSTIGQALALTVLREERDRRDRLAARRPLTATEQARRERNLLVGQREILLAKRTQLFATHGPAARDLPEWKSIDEEMAELDRRLSSQQPVPAAR